jgi:nucleotide-binding universal stress UspA family protein
MKPTIRRRSTPAQLQLKRILVPVDFSVPSQEALNFARRLASSFGADITLLHVVENMPVAVFPEMPAYLDYSGEDFDAAERDLQALAAEVAGGLKTVRAMVRNGLAAHEIVEAARELDSDLIVIATHGYTGWKHFCLGSTAERVVRTAPCPVFVARAKEHELV